MRKLGEEGRIVNIQEEDTPDTADIDLFIADHV